MGIRGALRAFEVYGLLRWARAYFDEHRPDLWIGVDSPSMNFHFARAAKERGIPTLQYVAPQLWAWAQWRMKKLRRWVDHVACILPFEEQYFRSHGVEASFVGHPLFDELPAGRGQAVQEGPKLPDRPPIVGLLPGSRKSEAEANFRRMLEVARQAAAVFPNATFLVPTTPATHPVVEAALAAARQAGSPVPGMTQVRQDAFDELVPRCDVCLTVSGTATLHVASFRVPMVVVYGGSPLLWNALGRWLIKTRTFALVNLLAAPSPTEAEPACHIVPEFVPWAGSTSTVGELLIDLLRNPQRLEAQRAKLDGLLRQLDRPGGSHQAARLALDMIENKKSEVEIPLPRPAVAQ
jgi:lipid-A-disaccharide synthase